MNKKIIIAIVVTLIVIAAGVGAWFMFFADKEEDTYYELPYNMDFDAAVSELSNAKITLDIKEISSANRQTIRYSIRDYAGVKGANARIMYMFEDRKLVTTAVTLSKNEAPSANNEYPAADEVAINELYTKMISDLNENYVLSIDDDETGKLYTKSGKAVSIAIVESSLLTISYTDVEYWKKNYGDDLSMGGITLDE